MKNILKNNIPRIMNTYYYGLLPVNSTHILQGYYTDTGAIIRLPQCQGSNVVGYGGMYPEHYSDAIMSAMASQITGVSIVCSIICSGADNRKPQSSASLVFMMGIHQWQVYSPHKGPVTRKYSIWWRHHDATTTRWSTTEPCVYFVGYNVGVKSMYKLPRTQPPM